MPDTHPTDDVSLLARSIMERIAPLCAHVPPSEMRQVTSRLAWLELAHATSAVDDVPDAAPAIECGNQVVRLRGPMGPAIVLPAGEEAPRRAPSLTEIRASALRYAGTVKLIGHRGALAIGQVGAALVSAFQARVRVQ